MINPTTMSPFHCFRRLIARSLVGVLLAGPVIHAQDITEMIAKLPPGKTVRISYNATVDAAAPLPGTSPAPVNGLYTISQQGQVTAAGLGTVVTDDPDFPGTSNPTLTTAGIGVLLALVIEETLDPVLAGFNLPVNLTHQVKVINEGSSPASGVVVSFGATAPPGVSLAGITPSPGTTSSGATWTVGGLPVGSMQALDLDFAVPATASGGVDTIASNAVVVAYNEADPPPAGSSPANDAESTSVVSPSDLAVTPGAIVFNAGTGRLQQIVNITNNNPLPVPGFLVTIDNLPGDVTVFNATGMQGGMPFIASSQTIAPGATFPLLVEFQRPGNNPGFTPVYTIELLSAAAAEDLINGTEEGVPIALIRAERDAQGRFLIEWVSTPGRTYFVRFSEDLENFTTVTPGITAAGATSQFLDDGPPRTFSAPDTVDKRFYQVLEAE